MGVGFAGSWPWVVLVMMLLVLALLILVVYFRSKFASVGIILRDFNKKHDQGEMGGRAKRSGSLSAWTLQVILTFMKVLRFFGDRQCVISLACIRLLCVCFFAFVWLPSD